MVKGIFLIKWVLTLNISKNYYKIKKNFAQKALLNLEKCAIKRKDIILFYKLWETKSCKRLNKNM